MSTNVFLDTGIFVAWLVRADSAHEVADKLFANPPPKMTTSLAVVSEAYSWFLHRFDESRARLFRQALAEVPALTILGLDLQHHAAAERTLDRFQGQGLTYVDASCLVFVKQKNIPTVWGTDRHLAIAGAEVVPGPV